MARRRCLVCGSKQWRKEPASGLITCGEGHVLQNYRNETSELNEAGPHALRKRALKSGRQKRERQSKADPKLYHGDRGRYHYYQCLQLLLRMQITVLIDAWDLPPEFEVVCRDVWALHLALLPSPPPAEPYLYALEHFGEQTLLPKVSSPPLSPEDIKQGKDRDEDASTEASGSSSSLSSSEGEEVDSEMEKLLRANSEAPSSEDEDEEGGVPVARPVVESRKRRRTRVHGDYDPPAANLAVLMIACWTLRIPIMYMDLRKLIESYDLPYLDPVRVLPQALTLHLTKQTKQALSPHFAPSTLVVHNLTTRLARLMFQKHSVHTPECNAAPLLWRAIRHLHGTPVLYTLSKKLAGVLSLTLTLHHSLSPSLKRVKKRDPEYHKYDNAPVEVSLAAVAIIVLKLVYGLDGKKRVPVSPEDPACALPNLTEYISAIKRLNEQDRSVQGRLFSATDDMPSALDLDDCMMDEYLDFCEKALLSPSTSTSRKDENIVLRDFFPLQQKDPASPHRSANPNVNADTLSETLSAVRLREDSTGLRPGQSYRIYNTQDILGTVPEQYELIVQRVARWAGVEDDYVCGVVEKFERRFARWWDHLRRRERAGGLDENAESDSDEDGDEGCEL